MLQVASVQLLHVALLISAGMRDVQDGEWMAMDDHKAECFRSNTNENI
jgi:hypothetical protein